MIGPLIRKLERLGTLTDEDRQALEVLPLSPRPVEADRDLAHDGERISQCSLLIEGFACRYKALEDGRRQIVSFHIPGDVLDLTSLLLGEMDHGLSTLTPVKVVAIAHATVLGWMRTHPNLAQLLWRAALIEAAIFREWVVSVGRRTARERTAHLLCELVVRMRAVDLARGYTCDLPITQVELADALGLSNVHVNRTLQELRGDGLIELGGGTLVVRDWDALTATAEFDPRYLHQLAAGEWTPA